MNGRLDETADVIEVVLLAVVSAALAPTVIGLLHLRVRVDEAVRIPRRGGSHVLQTPKLGSFPARVESSTSDLYDLAALYSDQK